MEEKEQHSDYNNDTWLSLMGLLHPSEFLVTVDQKHIWRKHIAWSKPNGKDLRDYTTQRFSSNMVFLSLILAAELNVLFNGSPITTEMRAQMMQGNYGSVKHWIGYIILLSACVTITALVSTFTAWGMVSSIGDKNAHCLLRSSIGQLVTSLPSNYVVASLYLFLTWLVLFIVELTTGPMRLILLAVVLYLFFSTVVSLSAFGRLIIHTGAMAEKPVLDPALEQALLPSGLHASLLIKATDRKRRHVSVISAYRSPNKRRQNKSDHQKQPWSFTTNETSHHDEGSPNDSTINYQFDQSGDTSSTEKEKQKQSSRTNSLSPSSTCSSTATPGTQQPVSKSPNDEAAIESAARAFQTSRLPTSRSDDGFSTTLFSPCYSTGCSEKERLLKNNANSQAPYGLNVDDGDTTMQDSCSDFHESFGSLARFPRASVLNKSTSGTSLKEVVAVALSASDSQSSLRNQQAMTSTQSSETPLRRGGSNIRPVDRVKFSVRSEERDSISSFASDNAQPKNENIINDSHQSNTKRQGRRGSIFARARATSRRSLLLGFRPTSVRVQDEWNEDTDVRSMYNVAPPAEVVFEDGDSESDEDELGREVVLPHPRILNQTRRARSLRRLCSSSTRDTSSTSSLDGLNGTTPGTNGDIESGR